MKTTPRNKLASEQGSILILCLVIMALLALLGAIATSTTISEMGIAANERIYNQGFYVADSGWQEAAMMLDGKPMAPETVSDTDKTVDLSAEDTTPNTMNNIPYDYTIRESINQVAAGSGPGYRQFVYEITSSSRNTDDTENRQQVRVAVRKLWKTGY